MRSKIALVLALLLLAGCKSTDDYLRDLDSMTPEPPAGANFMAESTLVFDAGQLAHEAFAGLATAEQMEYWQVMRSLSFACEFLGKARHNPLLQAEAATLIGVLVAGYPLPPIDRPLDPVAAAPEPTVEQLNLLVQAHRPLTIERNIAGLESADQVVVLEAERELERLTGEKLGPNPDAWRTWFADRRDDYLARFMADSRGPLEYFANQRYNNASEARGVLRILALWVESWGYEELAPLFIPALDRVARQACVYGLADSMQRNKDSTVRAEVAEAMMQIRDPLFGEALASQLPLERDPYAASKMVRALRYYPSRNTIEQILTAMSIADDQVMVNAVDVLRELTGEDFGTELDAWLAWWRESGAATWR
ncbi:MAG: hypothetical protein H6807_01915 [Planctomycetes bacterium]|nr:hypothetical protein [Planctomycetota bacterium]